MNTAVVLRLYAGVASAALLTTGAAGFSRLWGFDPLSAGLYHGGLGAMFAYACFFQRDPVTLRRIVGGLGVLLLVVESAYILGMLAVFGTREHGTAAVTGLVLGLGSVLAARYLPEEP